MFFLLTKYVITYAATYFAIAIFYSQYFIYTELFSRYLDFITATVSDFLIIVLNLPVVAIENTLYSNNFAISIDEGCAGFVLIVVPLCFFLAIPIISLKSRLIYVVTFLFSMLVLNVIRIISLFLIGHHNHEMFEVWHVTLWPALQYTISVLALVIALMSIIRKYDARMRS